MGRKKVIACNLVFDETEKLEDKLMKMFSSENLICCFSEKNFEEYSKVINDEKIQAILNDNSIMDTINVFFDSNLNTSITSEKTFMHRNTLNYKLEKVRKLIGLNLKHFAHAMVFKNLLIVRDIINQ